MKLRMNAIIQGLAVFSGAVAQYSDLVPAKYRGAVTSAAALTSALAGFLAHFFNPDGTSATTAYNPAPAVPKLPSDYKG